ncbi:hypothetical protein CTA1_7237 [Colletotrichum tanaceti]|uniref:Uncharacterized protein n=1 Tax=Colletotrichum tanaceti TaxID=1306861 RepID=A0A4U6XL75_9PEZI|nr:hypothetical protein CTA1_7237 [Colletotrichum tanaceti]
MAPAWGRIRTGVRGRASSRSSRRPSGLLDDDIARLLRHDVQRQGDVEAGDLGEDAGVDDPQAVGAADPEARVEDGHGVVVGPDGTGARRVVAPRLVLEEPLGVLLARDVAAAGPDLREAPVERDEAAERPAGELEPLVRRLQVLVGLAAVVDARVVVVEVDGRHVPGVGRPEGDGAGVVAAVRLEDDPGPVPRVGERVGGVARELALELGRRPRDEEVGLVLGDGGPEHDGDGDAVGGVDPLGDGLEALAVLLEAGVRRRLRKGALAGDGEVARRLADHRGLVAVLHVGTDAGEVDQDGDAERLELRLGADPAELEQLGRVEGAGRDDDLPLGVDAAGSRGRRRAGTGVGAVEAGSLQEVDPDSPGLVATRLIKADLGDLIYISSVPGPAADGVGHGQRDLVEARLARLAGRVDVPEQDLAEPGDGIEQEAEEALAHGRGGRDDERQQLAVLDDERQGRERGAEPAAVAVADDARGQVHVPLELLEVGPHPGRRPRVVAGQGRHLGPVAVMGVDRDEGVVAGAAAQGAGARVPDAEGLRLGWGVQADVEAAVRHLFHLVSSNSVDMRWRAGTFSVQESPESPPASINNTLKPAMARLAATGPPPGPEPTTT